MTVNPILRLPDTVSHPLDFWKGWLSIIVPTAKVNLLDCPSFEDGLGDNWATQYLSSPSVGTTELYQTSGAKCLSVEPNSTAETGVSCRIFPAKNTKYTISFDFRTDSPTSTYVVWVSETPAAYVGGRPHLYIPATSEMKRSALSFVLVDYSSDVFVTWVRLGGSGADLNKFYLDSVQLEEGDETTYFDGDSQPLTVLRPEGELSLPQFYWTGEPHKSTSVRSEFTRAGGTKVNLRGYGWVTTAIVGMGMPNFEVIGAPYAFREGSEFRRSSAQERDFTVVGKIVGRDLADLSAKRQAISEILSPLNLQRPQPIVLEYQATDECGDPIGNPIWIDVNYTGGFGGNRDNYIQEDVTLNFRSLSPYVRRPQQRGAYLEKRLALAGRINRRSAVGQWEDIAFGAFANNLGIVKYGPDGALYATYFDSNLLSTIRRLAPGATSWTTIVSVVVINGAIGDIVFTPDWKLWFAVSSAPAGKVGVYDLRLGGAVTWNDPPGMDPQEYVHDLAVDPRGGVYAVSSFFNGVDFTGKVRRYDTYQPVFGWKLFGTAEGRVYGVAVSRTGRVYVTGEFDNIQDYAGTWIPVRSAATMIPIGIEYYWEDMNVGIYATGGSLPGIGNSIEVAPDSSVFVGGLFGYAGGTTTPVGDANNIARFNGTGWEPLRTGVEGGDVTKIYIAPSGEVFAFGDFTSVDGFPINKSARYRNGYWTPFYIRGDLAPGTWSPTSMDFGNGGEIALITNATVTSKVAGYTRVNNPGTYPSNVTIRVTGEGTLYYIINHSTQNDIYFNGGLFVYYGEVITMQFSRLRPLITSNIRGDLSPFITPTSRLGNFRVLPGDNHFEVMMDYPATTNGIESRVLIYWDLLHLGVDAAVKRG